METSVKFFVKFNLFLALVLSMASVSFVASADESVEDTAGIVKVVRVPCNAPAPGKSCFTCTGTLAQCGVWMNCPAGSNQQITQCYSQNPPTNTSWWCGCADF